MSVVSISASSSAVNVARSTLTARRKVNAAIHAEGSWIHGDLVFPRAHSLLHHLNQSNGFLRLTHVRLPGVATPVDFMALRSEALSFIVPGSEEQIVSAHVAPPKRHKVTCLFPFGSIDGSLETVHNIRVSDFLVSGSTFFALHNCVLHLRGHQALAAPIVIVNAPRTIGVTHSHGG